MESESKKTNWVIKARPIKEPKGDEPPTPGLQPESEKKKPVKK